MAVSQLRAIPAVEQVLQTPQAAEWLATYGRGLTVEAVRQVLAQLRAEVLAAPADTAVPPLDTILQSVAGQLGQWSAPQLIPVINATGVILHTNLGRAPLSSAAVQAMLSVAGAYSNLELDLHSGKRGSRHQHCAGLLSRLTGAEAALVVSNNAAAVLLALTALARRRRVIISRGQLVEIGGGFRVPEVMAQSGARLVEVGATNRVHLTDYETALEEPAALVMRAHPSNFRVIGFTHEPELSEIVQVAHQHGVAVLDDLGSGALLDTAQFGLSHEPTVAESLAAGVDLVCFSGDKLLGGPQAGILVGKSALIERIQRHPLARALRIDKVALAALETTLRHYLLEEAERVIPVWRMISEPVEEIHRRAAAWQTTLGQGVLQTGESTVGGGSLPGETLPTWLLCLPVNRPDAVLRALRWQSPPVIARVAGDQVVLDPRTVLLEQEGALLAALRTVLPA